MAEALDPRELDAALGDDVPKFPIDDRPRTINDLPKELLVSVFEAVEDQTWVRLTFPLVCKEWAEIYRSRDASPLHETLEVDFLKEAVTAAQDARRRGLGPAARAAGQGRALRTLLSTARGSSRGPMGAPAGCAGCNSGGNTAELSKTSARRTWAGSSPSWGLL